MTNDAFRLKLEDGFIERLESLISLVTGGGMPAEHVAKLLTGKAVAIRTEKLPYEEAGRQVGEDAEWWAEELAHKALERGA